jgi:hypothetical protein
MHIVHVFISVDPQSIEAFRLATLDNARNSLQEPGVARFDFLEDVEQSGRFTLVESTDDGRRAPKDTPHYNGRRCRLMAAPHPHSLSQWPSGRRVGLTKDVRGALSSSRKPDQRVVQAWHGRSINGRRRVR